MFKQFLHKLSSVLALMLFSSTASAQVLYQISGNGALAKSYILATYPTCDISFLDSIPNLFRVYGRCNKVVTDMAINDYQALATLRQSALLPDSVQLRNFYTDDEYEQINEALSITLGLGLDKLGRMKPSYLTELYRNELLKRWLNYDEERSITTFFPIVAAENNIPIYALDELGESLYMMFDREPFYFQCKQLLNIIEYPERELQLERRLLALYRNGQLMDMAYQVSGPNNLSTLSFSDYQIYCQRNTTWVKRLRPYLREGSCFISLNALYLGGEQGLIAQLKAAGYKVRPVNRH